MVVFEIFFFKPEYVELVKKREIDLDPSLEDSFVPEIGGMLCLNVARPMSIRFFSLDEALELISAGYQVSIESGNSEPLKEEKSESFPSDMVNKIVIELSGLFEGSFVSDTRKDKFKSRKQLKELLKPLTEVK